MQAIRAKQVLATETGPRHISIKECPHPADYREDGSYSCARVGAPPPKLPSRRAADLFGPFEAEQAERLMWRLDRIVRPSASLIERMTLTWHDWLATSNQVVQ